SYIDAFAVTRIWQRSNAPNRSTHRGKSCGQFLPYGRPRRCFPSYCGPIWRRAGARTTTWVGPGHPSITGRAAFTGQLDVFRIPPPRGGRPGRVPATRAHTCGGGPGGEMGTANGPHDRRHARGVRGTPAVERLPGPPLGAGLP